MMRLAITTALAVGLVAAARYRADLVDYIGTSDTVEADDGGLEVNADVTSVQALLSQLDFMSDTTMTTNVQAFLAMLRKSEGTAGPDGYRTLFGGSKFSGWADHPRVAKQFTDKAGRRLWTSAAGAYQFMAISPIPGGGSTKVNTWDRLKAKLGLDDFSPASQDAAAVELLNECGALAKINAGDFPSAVNAARRIWASLPGAGYAQNEQSLSNVQTWYVQAGGTLA
jgi:muramidase (phage lysozyme)